MIKLAPSLVSAPMDNLRRTVQELEAAGADLLHFDIEDGSFVPEINLGIKIIRDLRQMTKLPFDVHLMMNNPEWLIPRLAEYGADMVSVHFEACSYPRRTLGIIKGHGLQAGLAFNPKTPVPPLRQYAPYLDFVLILTTEPEQNCPFLASVLDKVAAGRQQAPGLMWIVDGGITADNVGLAGEAGADLVVSGRAVFANGQIRENIARIKQSLPNTP